LSNTDDIGIDIRNGIIKIDNVGNYDDINVDGIDNTDNINKDTHIEITEIGNVINTDDFGKNILKSLKSIMLWIPVILESIFVPRLVKPLVLAKPMIFVKYSGRD